MRVKLLVGVLGLVLGANRAPAADSVLVWSDEFNQKGLPDNSKWDYDVGGSGMGNQEAQLYTRARAKNAWVDGSDLVITAVREDTGTCWYGPCKFTSARLLTKGKADWLYGRVDVRAKLPSGIGVWPAIWMLPTASPYGGWPDEGEIDIMENVGYDSLKNYSTVHFHNNGQAQGSVTSTTLAKEYHLYSLVWMADSLMGQFDGKTIFKYPRTGNWQQWPFDQKFYLILNLAIGGQWGGAKGLDTAKLGNKELRIDYVRVYKYVQGVGPFTVATKILGQGSVARTPDQPNYPGASKIVLLATPAAGWEFNSFQGALTSHKNPDTLSVMGNDTVHALFVPAGERVGNGAFASGLHGWSWWSDASVGGEASLVAGEVCLHPGAPGTDNWMAQFKWPGISFNLGESYDLAFVAHSRAARTLQTGLVQDNTPFAGLATGWTANLGVSRTQFSHRFVVTKAEPFGRLEFDFGSDSTTFCLDSISLIKVGATGIEARNRAAQARQVGAQVVPMASGIGSEKLRDAKGRRRLSGAGVVFQPRDPTP